ncbi:MAG TPA: type I polyketide synthase [Vicinamibacterales bacterium]|nr:type I polyketide synthase [Vicinamibacterales bacterium]
MSDSRLGQDAASRAAAIRDWLVAAVASRVGIDGRRIDLTERFSRYGIDSMKAAGITAELSAFLEQPLPRTLLWDHPSIAAVARHLTASADGGSTVAVAPSGISGEPIAIVGLACRFPGAPDTDAFWRLLLDGTDAISEVPADRWNIGEMFSADPAVPGKMSTRWGGFLSDVDRFDPQFFGISPREAEHMDPQQRIVLELAWRALEDAGIRPASLKDSSTGVYIGAMWSDYARLIAGTPSAITQHTATGQDTSIIAARVSYTFGLQGPSVAINTACSSSLVAVHTACQALRTGEATLALAGGVNLVLAPDSTVAMSKFGGMAPDGRSKAFDARANGYVRSEGAGIVVLKPLSRALKDGDPIYCLIRGEGVNNDGFSNGLTAPNPQAQEQMLRIACARAGVQPADVDYVETHGTGTLLGDPIEAGALGRVLGAGRPDDRPLRVGSLKSNIGHLEAAAGIAGLIKLALSLRRGVIPGNLHFETPNPHIDFSALRLAVQAQTSPLPVRERAVIAGVSSFGFGGTNCHVVLEQWRGADSVVVPLSADSPERLREAAATFAAAAQAEGDAADPIAWSRTAWEQLSGGPHRGAVLVRAPRDLAPQLSLLASGQTAPGVSPASAVPAGRRVWVCSPHGGQWTGMGRELLHAEPAFRAAIERCEPLIQREGGWSILDEILAGEKTSRLGDVAVAQAAIFAIQVGIADVLRSWGLQPDVVIGHSMGEVAAAHIAGVLSLEDAVKVICHRSRLLAKTAGKGALAVVGLSAEATRTALEGRGDQLWVVAFNSPKSTLVSGEPETLGALLADLERDGVFCRRVRVDVAAHSPHMDPLLAELAEVTASVTPSRGRAAMVSTVTGGVLEGTAFDASYWVRNLRQSVLFSQAVDAILAEGPATFVEIGPHPVLAPAIEQALAASAAGGRVIETMRRAEPERDALLDAAARLYVAGHAPRWDAFTPAADTVALPEGVAANGTCRTEDAAALPFLLSAHTPRTLADRARATASALRGNPALMLRDVCYTAAARRAAQPQRLAAVARSTGELADLLERFAGGEIAPGVSVGEREVAGPGRTAFVFPGQGAQWLGMGRRLMKEEPAFLASLQRCDAAVRAAAGWSVIDELNASPGASRLDRIDVIQPVLFSVQVALADLWRAWGVTPDAVVGHSMGEVAAAHAAGALSLEDAARLICCRSALMRTTSGRGAMAAVELSLSEAALAIRGLEDRVSVAVSNAPRATVLSGDPETIDLLMARLTAEGVFCKRVKVDVASHSPQMDVLLGDLRRGIDGIAPRAASVPFYSTVAGTLTDGAELGVDYWTRNLREPVLFATAVARLCADGFDTFVEMSPHPLLVPAVQESLRAEKRAGVAVGSFVRDDADERASMLASLGALFAHGHDLEWQHVFADRGRVVPIGPYCFEKQRCWLDAEHLERRAPAEQADGYLFETEWIEQPLPDVRAGRQHTWLVLANPGSACAAAAQRLESSGHRVNIVPAPRRLHAVDRLPTDDEEMRALEDLLLPELSDCDAVVYGWGFDAPDAPAAVDALADAMDAATLNAVRLVQILDRVGVSPRLYLVTSGAQPAGGAQVTAPSRTGLWGLGSAIAVEHPEMRCTRIDLDDAAAPAALAAELAAAPDEDQVAFRRDRRFVARLKKGIDALAAGDNINALAALAKSNPAAVRAALGSLEGLDDLVAALGRERTLPDFSAGTCLVTGGLTGLGLVTAEWIVGHGGRSVALLGRRAPSAAALTAIERMRQAGATVAVLQADASRADDLSRALAEIRATMRPIRGVIHAAGVLDDAVLARMTPEQYRNVLAPKVRGGWLLHQLTKDDDVDYFVLYSSVLAYLGAAGQANHAIANAFLDGLAHYRRGRGLAAVSVNWGVWSSVGSAAAAGRGDRLGAMGLSAITPAEGCEALERILASGAVQGSVMRFSADAWRQNLSGAARSTFLANFVKADGEAAADRPAAGEPALLEVLTAAPPAERRGIVERFVAARAARVLRLGADQIDVDKPLRAMGLDSLLAVEFRNRLEADTGLSIPTTLIWNYPTVAKLAPQVAERLGIALDGVAAAGTAPTDELDELLGALESMSDEDARSASLLDDAARRALLGGTRVADV